MTLGLVLLAVAVTAAITWAITKSLIDGDKNSMNLQGACEGANPLYSPSEELMPDTHQAAYRIKAPRVKLNSNLPSTPSAGVSDKLQAIKNSLLETREANERGHISERVKRMPGEIYNIRDAFVDREKREYHPEQFLFNQSTIHE
jgi:hypothetical protein